MKKIILFSLILFVGFRAFAQTDTVRKTTEVGLVFSNFNSFGLCYKVGNQNTLFRITVLSLTGASNNSNYSNYTYNGVNDTVPSAPTSSFGAGLNIGFEKRKRVGDKLYFYYGLVLTSSYSESKTNVVTPTNYGNISYYNLNNDLVTESAILNATSETNTWTINSGLGIVTGVAYKLSSHFSVGAELIPTVSYSYSESKGESTAYAISWLSKGAGLGYTLYTYPLNATANKITKGISYSILNTNAAITVAFRIK